MGVGLGRRFRWAGDGYHSPTAWTLCPLAGVFLRSLCSRATVWAKEPDALAFRRRGGNAVFSGTLRWDLDIVTAMSAPAAAPNLIRTCSELLATMWAPESDLHAPRWILCARDGEAPRPPHGDAGESGHAVILPRQTGPVKGHEGALLSHAKCLGNHV